MKKYPFYEAAKAADEIVQLGGEVYQKFECGNCNALQHIETPNAFYIKGKCEECGHVTDLKITWL